MGDAKVVYVGTATDFTDFLTNGKQYHYKIFAHDELIISNSSIYEDSKDWRYQRIAAGYTNNYAVDSNNSLLLGDR